MRLVSLIRGMGRAGRCRRRRRYIGETILYKINKSIRMSIKENSLAVGW
jgi:hypothetical protein